MKAEVELRALSSVYFAHKRLKILCLLWICKCKKKLLTHWGVKYEQRPALSEPEAMAKITAISGDVNYC